MKIIKIIFVFLVGFVVGVAALWIALQFDTELRSFFQEPTLGDTLQSKISDFIDAVNRDDRSAALEYWEITSDDMKERRETVIDELLNLDENVAYRIAREEWWRTCCEPGVINESRGAGGARYAVQVYDAKGWSTAYTVDVFVRGQVYFGAAEGFPLRHWVIRDVYPSGEEPLYWPYKSEQRVEYIGSNE